MKMKKSEIKKVKIKKRYLILIPVILLFFPIKFTHHFPRSEKEFYIVQCISEGSTEGGSWVILDGNNNKEKKLDLDFENGFYFILKGKNPKDILSYDICNNYTQFIMYGDLTKEFYEPYGEDVYFLDCNKWKIYEEVKRGDYQLRIPFKHFITIYDLKCFDFLLSEKW